MSHSLRFILYVTLKVKSPLNSDQKEIPEENCTLQNQDLSLSTIEDFSIQNFRPMFFFLPFLPLHRSQILQLEGSPTWPTLSICYPFFFCSELILLLDSD